MSGAGITPAMIAASASLPLIGLPGGVTVSRFHSPPVPTTGAEKQMVRAAENAVAASQPPAPIRTPTTYRQTQARLQLTYAAPRTVLWSRAGDA